MKRLIINLSVVIAVIVITGLIRQPFEQKMREDMHRDKVLPVPISMSKRNELGQAGYAAAFGGLRPVLASYFYLKAHNLHADRNWYEMTKTYETIVAMQPDSEFYWEMAGWQLAINTSSLVSRNREVGPLERVRQSKHYIAQGDNFLCRGLEHIPDSESLKSERIRLLTDIFRIPDFEEAVAVSESLLKQDNLSENDRLQAMSSYAYNLSAIPGRESEAYQQAVKLWNISNDFQRVPSLACILYVLQNQLAIAPELRISEKELFYDPRFLEEKVGSVVSFIGSAEVSDRAGIGEMMKQLYKEWQSTPPLKRDDLLRVKILVLERALQSKGSPIAENQFYYNTEHKNYINELATLRETLKSLEGKDRQVYGVLLKKYKAEKLKPIEGLVLAFLQKRLEGQIVESEKISNSQLIVNPFHKVRVLRTYWESVNNEVLSSIDKGNDTMRYRPTFGVLEELRKIEDLYNVPINQRIKNQDVYQDQPFAK